LADSGPGLAAIWPEEAIKQFEGAWIETPFQLMSIALGPSGMESLISLTGLPSADIQRFLEQTRQLLTDNERAQLARPFKPEEMPLGALKPKP
jgi:hypothetical protein